MQNVLKRFGEKGIGSFDQQLTRARTVLTSVYVLLAAGMLVISFSVTHSVFSTQLDHRFRLQQQKPVVQQAAEIRSDLRTTQIRVNALLLLGAGVLSYFLAGITLMPVKRIYERQREFLGDASHELRTPLSVLQVELENELRSEREDVRKNQIESKLEEVRRMSVLVEDMLTLSRLEEHRPTSTSQVDLAQVLQEEVNRLKKIAEARNIIVSLEAETVMAKVDVDLLKRAVGNVIKNAIMYNKESGSVRVAVTQSGHDIVIRVSDTGIGMTAGELRRVFDRFYRVEKSRTRSAGGNGLGLAITQSAVEAMGGSIEIDSNPGEGTEVRIMIRSYPRA